MTDDYAPSASDHFTSGLWTVDNQLVTELLLGAR
jgi:hypothetical protein